MIYKVLTPPPGFHAWRRLQNLLAASGRPMALSLPPLCVLGDEEALVRLPTGPLRWVRTANGWGLGQDDDTERAAFGSLAPSFSWLFLPWDWEDPPPLQLPDAFPQKKYRLALLHLEICRGGIRWYWVKEESYLLPVGL